MSGIETYVWKWNRERVFAGLICNRVFSAKFRELKKKEEEKKRTFVFKSGIVLEFPPRGMKFKQ